MRTSLSLDQTRQRSRGSRDLLDDRPGRYENAVQDLIEQPLRDGRNLCQPCRPDQAPAALERMKGAPQDRKHFPVSGVSDPTPKRLVDASLLLARLVQEDVEELGVDMGPRLLGFGRRLRRRERPGFGFWPPKRLTP